MDVNRCHEPEMPKPLEINGGIVRFMESRDIPTRMRMGSMNTRLLHLTRFRPRLRRVGTTLSPARAAERAPAEGRFMESRDLQKWT